MAVIGVKVELEGAPVFTKNLSMLSQQTKLYQEQLKRIDATMSGTTNTYSRYMAKTQALKQSQQALQAQSDRLASKIRELNDAGKGQTAYATRLRTQYQQVATQLAEVGREIEQQGGKFDAINAQFTAIGDKFKSVGGKIAGVGGAITKAATPIYAAFAGSVKSAIDWESSFTGVMKVVSESANTTYKDLENGIKQMSTTTASSKEEIAAVAEAAGRLGVPTDDIMKFTETMIKLGDTTNVSAEEAATALARFVNITGDGTGSVDKLGSSIVALGNNFATDEASIINMSQRLAAAGKISGLTSTDVLALATAMSSVGIEAEAGGTAMSQTLTQISKAVSEGGDKLETMAQIAGTTSEEFAQKWKTKPIEALQDFIKGLGDMNESGGDTYGVLEKLGMTGIRQSNMLQSLSLANDQVAKAVKISSDAYKSDNETKGKANALSAEAAKRYQTEAAKINQTKERISNLAIQVGNKLLPYVEKVLKAVNNLVTWFGNLNTKTQDTIIKIGGIIAVVGPLITFIGSVVSAIGTVISAVGSIIGAIGPVISFIAGIGETIVGIGNIIWAVGTTIMTALAPVLSVIGSIASAVGAAIAALNPVTLVIAAIVAAIAAFIAIFVTLFKHNDEFRAKVIEVWEAVKSGISSAIDAIKNWLINAWNVISTTTINVFTAIKDFIVNVWNAVKNTAITVWNGITSVISSAINGAKNIITTVWNAVSGFISSVMEKIKSIFSTGWNIVKDTIGSVWGAIKSAASGGIGGLVDLVATIPKKLFNILGNLGKTAVNWGKDLLSGFINGIKSKIGDLKNTIAGVGDKVKSFLHFTEPDEGPLKNFNSWAPDMMRNYSRGILDNKYLVANAVSDVASDVATLANLNNQQLDSNEIYNAVNRGTSDANITVTIGDRELARKLREMGVVFE